jgi:1,4-alpha-glucan branching enzyme
MQKIGGNGAWQIKLPLAKGKYRYRLVVDGHWQQDPYNETTETNPFGESNSVLEVQ